MKLISAEYQQKLIELSDLLSNYYVHRSSQQLWLNNNYPELLDLDDIGRINEVIEKLKYMIGEHR